jgi:hypothetical protein
VDFIQQAGSAALNSSVREMAAQAGMVLRRKARMFTGSLSSGCSEDEGLYVDHFNLVGSAL